MKKIMIKGQEWWANSEFIICTLFAVQIHICTLPCFVS